MDYNLKTCPFCGSTEVYYTIVPDQRKPQLNAGLVYCDRCSARVGGLTRHDAVKIWNSRVVENYLQEDITPVTGKPIAKMDYNELVNEVQYIASILKDQPYHHDAYLLEVVEEMARRQQQVLNED